MISIKKYSNKDKKLWDNFILSSNNGTLFHCQSFLSYHIDRHFVDYSLIIKKNNQIIALLPAAIKICNSKKILYSHPGASFGGFVFSLNMNFKLLNNIIIEVEKFCIKNNIQSIIMINTPLIYYKQKDESLNYLLLWNKYIKKEHYISHFIDLSGTSNVKLLLKKRKQRYLNKLLLNKKFNIRPSNNFKDFYRLLIKSKKEFKTQPTHSIQELQLLSRLFPEKIKLLLTRHNSAVVGGCLLFFTNIKTCLVFYNVIDKQFRTSQLSAFQLFRCMRLAKINKFDYLDLGVSHIPISKNPLEPKFSLIQFKEQFGAQGIMRKVYKKDF